MHSLHSYFIRPGDPSIPIVYEVDRVRDGRSFSTRRVIAVQHGKPIFTLSASFQLEQAGHRAPAADAGRAAAGVAADARRAATRDSPERGRVRTRRCRSPIDLRYVDDPPWQQRAQGPRERRCSRVWMRADGALPDDPLLHVCVLTFASDMTLLDSVLVRHGLAPGLDPIAMASLDHAMWFQRPFRADEWLLYSTKSPSARGRPRPGHRPVLRRGRPSTSAASCRRA